MVVEGSGSEAVLKLVVVERSIGSEVELSEVVVVCKVEEEEGGGTDGDSDNGDTIISKSDHRSGGVNSSDNDSSNA